MKPEDKQIEIDPDFEDAAFDNLPEKSITNIYIILRR